MEVFIMNVCWMSPPNSYADALAPSVMVRRWGFGEVIRFRCGHEGGAVDGIRAPLRRGRDT